MVVRIEREACCAAAAARWRWRTQIDSRRTHPTSGRACGGGTRRGGDRGREKQKGMEGAKINFINNYNKSTNVANKVTGECS